MFRKFVFGGSVTGLLFGAVYLAANLSMEMKGPLCGLDISQPALSDWCGSIGIPDFPTQEEREASEALDAESCDDLRDFINHFPASPIADRFTQVLLARHVEVVESWSETEKSLALFLYSGTTLHASEEDARAATTQRSQAEADDLCGSFEASGDYRFLTSETDKGTWVCRAGPGGHACSLETHAVCHLEERQLTEIEVCSDRS